jgi:hypothetical protein
MRPLNRDFNEQLHILNIEACYEFPDYHDFLIHNHIYTYIFIFIYAACITLDVEELVASLLGLTKHFLAILPGT